MKLERNEIDSDKDTGESRDYGTLFGIVLLNSSYKIEMNTEKSMRGI